MGMDDKERQAAFLPALFLLGLFTVYRLVDTGIENQQYLTGIARIRGYYRTLTPSTFIPRSLRTQKPWPSPAMERRALTLLGR